VGMISDESGESMEEEVSVVHFDNLIPDLF